ncbi:MAG TPA: hypothetical protein PKM25_17045, partial [Candidatus Ozemobacteraceae bacterium]|nr:hypothetical protein [Candidatus Ozemobacteraceae bacterium]
MTLAQSISQLLLTFPEIRPELHEFTFQGRVSCDDASATEGIFVVHRGGIAFAAPAGILAKGFAAAGGYDDIALAQISSEKYEFHLVQQGIIRKFYFIPAPQPSAEQQAGAALRIRLRMADIVHPGSEWPAAPFPDCTAEKAAEGATQLRALAAKFPGQPVVTCWLAALLDAAGNPGDALSVIAARGAARSVQETLMLIVSLLCAGKIYMAEYLICDFPGDVVGIADARHRLELICRIHGTRRETGRPGCLEQLSLASALRDSCLEPAWPALRRILTVPGTATPEAVAAVLEEDTGKASRLIDIARRESWFDPLPSLLVEASCLALEGNFKTSFMRLWPARGAAAAAPLISLALAGGCESLVSDWLEASPLSSEIRSAGERIPFAHVLLRSGRTEKAAAVLNGITGEYRTALPEDLDFRLSLVEALMDPDVKKEKARRCFERLNGPGCLQSHVEALRFAAELRTALATAEASADHQRDARTEMIC